jgi:prolipoprotein diacylglyceryltransferase
MTIELWFVLGLAFGIGMLFSWAFRVLPREQWQMVAAVPRSRRSDGSWEGLNLTWYGVFSANAYVFAVALLLVLMRFLQVPPQQTATIIIAMLAVCVPASKLVARLIERRRFTFTVAGAGFVGTLFLPWLLVGINHFGGELDSPRVPVIATMAAVSICFAFGEALGRLACLSFGCCYGRPLSECPSGLQKLLANWSIVFFGKTKKAAFEGHHAGRPLVPIQAVTACILTGVAIAGLLLFLSSQFVAALLTTVVLTQLWRVLSEFLRQDDRGGGSLSGYQIMALLAPAYVIAVTLLVNDSSSTTPADILSGLRVVCEPLTILLLEVLWLTIFVYTGCSRVTHSIIEFDVRHDRV